MRSNLAELLKEGGRGMASGRRHRLQDGLVVLQMAVGLVLLTGAGFLVRSFTHFERMDPGFRPDRIATAQIAFTHERYPTPERLRVFLTSLVDRLETQPGVATASLSTWLPGIGAPFSCPCHRR